MQKKIKVITATLFLGAMLAGCNKAGEQAVVPTSTQKTVPNISEVVTTTPSIPMEVPTVEPTEEAEITPSETEEGATVMPTSEPTSIPTSEPTVVPTEAVEATKTPMPVATSTPPPTPVPTATSTPVPTSTLAPIPTSTLTPTNTPIPTATSMPIPTSTPTPTITSGPTPTPLLVWANGVSYSSYYKDVLDGKYDGEIDDETYAEALEYTRTKEDALNFTAQIVKALEEAGFSYCSPMPHKYICSKYLFFDLDCSYEEIVEQVNLFVEKEHERAFYLWEYDLYKIVSIEDAGSFYCVQVFIGREYEVVKRTPEEVLEIIHAAYKEAGLVYTLDYVDADAIEKFGPSLGMGWGGDIITSDFSYEDALYNAYCLLRLGYDLYYIEHVTSSKNEIIQNFIEYAKNKYGEDGKTFIVYRGSTSR